ncbi:hypothetical protein Ciccas_008607 [Cichlidogyrus casuarinus]|uniref:PH domain-containing protein n=1 Tax=Cichlidogyrus casuarinus TaxID=1844966 RepID=A0ABD2PZI2_9PLAT
MDLSTSAPVKPFVEIAIDSEPSLSYLEEDEDEAKTGRRGLLLAPFGLVHHSHDLDPTREWIEETSEDEQEYKDDNYKSKLSTRIIPLRLTINNDSSLDICNKPAWAQIYFPNQYSASNEHLHQISRDNSDNLDGELEVPSLVVFYARYKRPTMKGIDLFQPAIYSLSLKNLSYETMSSHRVRMVTRSGEGITLSLQFFNGTDANFWVSIINAQQRSRFSNNEIAHLTQNHVSSLSVSSPRMSRRSSLEPLSEMVE